MTSKFSMEEENEFKISIRQFPLTIVAYCKYRNKQNLAVSKT